MKIFDKKEEKNKVGRPKLADVDTKKKSIIMCAISSLLVIMLLAGGLVSLNILPNFNRLKGAANTSLCTEIPARFQPRSETNPEGLHEYGFTDPKFYSLVVSTYNDDASYCSTITEEELLRITSLGLTRNNIDNSNGIQYLSGLTSLVLNVTSLTSIDISNNIFLKSLELQANNLSSIDVSNNTALTTLELGNNNLSSIDVSNNTALTTLYLNTNKLSSIDVSKNTALTTLSLGGNNLSSIDVSKNTALTNLNLSNNNLSSIDVSQNTALTILNLYGNNLSSIDVSNNTALWNLDLDSNNFNKTYRPFEDKITIEEPNIKTAYPNATTYSITDSSIATYENGVVKILKPGSTTLKITYKVSSLITFTVNYTINFINLTSNYYTIDNENKTIDVKGEMLSNVYASHFSITPSNFQKAINGDKLEIKDSNGTKIDEYKITNYVLYKLTSSYYTIDNENKTIDIKGEILSNINIWNFSITPYNFQRVINKDKLEIKDNNGNLIDTYKLINARKEDENAYTKAGFKDKNLYTCVVRSYYDNSDISGNYLLTDEELEEVDYLECYNVEIKDTTGLEKLTNLQGLILYNNNLDSIKLPDSDLYALILANNNISGTLDLSKYENLEELYLQNNKLDKVVLPNSPNLQGVLLHNNNLKSIDLSNYPSLEVITLQNNPLSTIYMLKNATMKYSDVFKINSSIEVEYEIEDENVATYNNDTIKALKDGITTLKLYNENIASILPEFIDKCDLDYDNNEEYCDNTPEEEYMLPYFMSNEIKVYDIKSDVYKIDKEKKTIDVKGTNLDVSKVTITLDGLKGSIDGNYYVIKDGNREVDKYKILNPKVVVKETTTTKKEIASTTKSKTTTKSNTTTTKDNSDIELSTSIVPSILLQSIKGQDRNIVVTKDNITFTINGKDIENINGNIDLSVEIEDIEKTILKEELKEKVEKAVVLNFKNESELPGKVLVEVKETEEIKKTIGTKNINVYNYNKDKYNLVAEDLSLNNNKITFYVDKLGYYVLTNEKVEDKYVEVDDSMMGENTKLNKEINQKKIIIPIVIIVILITLGIVGYVRYKKNIKRHK